MTESPKTTTMDIAYSPASADDWIRLTCLPPRPVVLEHRVKGNPLYHNLGPHVAAIKQLEADAVALHRRFPEQGCSELAKQYMFILFFHECKLLVSPQRREHFDGILDEIHNVVADYENIVIRRLLPASKTHEAVVHCWATIADFHRLMWFRSRGPPVSGTPWFSTPNHAGNHWGSANHAYSKAFFYATEKMIAINPVRLAVTLSFATFKKNFLPDKQSFAILTNAMDASAVHILRHPHDTLANDSLNGLKEVYNKLKSWGGLGSYQIPDILLTVLGL